MVSYCSLLTLILLRSWHGKVTADTAIEKEIEVIKSDLTALDKQVQSTTTALSSQLLGLQQEAGNWKDIISKQQVIESKQQAKSTLLMEIRDVILRHETLIQDLNVQVKVILDKHINISIKQQSLETQLQKTVDLLKDTVTNQQLQATESIIAAKIQEVKNRDEKLIQGINAQVNVLNEKNSFLSTKQQVVETQVFTVDRRLSQLEGRLPVINATINEIECGCQHELDMLNSTMTEIIERCITPAHNSTTDSDLTTETATTIKPTISSGNVTPTTNAVTKLTSSTSARIGMATTSNLLAKGSCNKPADIVFVLDGSGSVGAQNFQTQLNFVQSVIYGFDVSGDKVRIGLMTFSTALVNQFHLNKFSNKADVINAIKATRYSASGTNTHLALDFLTTQSFLTANGARNNVQHIAILITDGRSNNPTATATAAAKAHAQNIKMFAIGIGSGYNLAELKAIGTDPDSTHVFTINDYTFLGIIREQLEKVACTGITKKHEDEADSSNGYQP